MPLPWPDLVASVIGPLSRLAEAGGPVLVAIGGVAMLLFSLVLERWCYFRFVWRRQRQALVARWVRRQEHAS